MKEFLENLKDDILIFIYCLIIIGVIGFLIFIFYAVIQDYKQEKLFKQEIMQNDKKPQKVYVCASQKGRFCKVYFEYSYDEFLKNKDILL